MSCPPTASRSRFLDVFDGFSIGSNDLTQLILGLDRDSGTLAQLFDERNDAVRRAIAEAITEAWIEVQDKGPGIPADVRARLLEPHFTSKGKQGTGLGVSIVYAFTQRHSGRLDIESEPGHGARFRMWFPASTIR